MPTATPFLWFDADLEEPISYYRGIFPGMKVHGRSLSPDGSTYFADIEILGQRFKLLNGGPALAGFRESFSVFVEVESQEEIDELWGGLTRDGGEEGQCGWLKDRYGLSWQIIPSALGGLIGGPDPARAKNAMDAMLSMHKLDLAGLQAAYDR